MLPTTASRKLEGHCANKEDEPTKKSHRTKFQVFKKVEIFFFKLLSRLVCVWVAQCLG